LELFILSCFDRGLATPYDLQRHASLSLGATSPALKRLKKDGLLTRAVGTNGTKRPRHNYTLSSEGKNAAQQEWKTYLTDSTPPSDLDSVLRIYEMAVHYKASRPSIEAFLRRAIEARRYSIAVLDVASCGGQSVVDLIRYPRLRAQFERARLSSEMTTLTEILGKRRKKKQSKIIQGSLLTPPRQ
jgi:DNA-binding PadR family transcriptional regulator